MRIAHIIPYFQPKLGYQEFYLAREQQNMGHEVRVITSDRYFPFPNFSETVGKILSARYVGSGIFHEEGIKVVRLPTLFEYNSYNYLLGLKKALTTFRPNVAHAHGESSPITMVTIALKDVLNYKVIVDCHMDYTLRSKSKIHSTLFYIWSRNPICRWLLRRADGFIAVAESSRIWLSTELGIHREKIEMIPLGAETDIFFSDMFKRRFMRNKLKVEENDILIVYAGKMHENKDIDILIRASSPLIKKYDNIKLILIGDGSKKYMDNLHKLVDEQNIVKNVLFFPFQPKTELPYYYNAADIGVWPGQDSITIIEAIATGLPVVIPFSYRNIHYIENGNGFHFLRGSWKELKERLEKLVIDKVLRKNMFYKSQEITKEKLGWDVITKNTIDF